jgi:hypothetical protein
LGSTWFAGQIVHGWLSPLHATRLLLHSATLTWLLTPPHVFKHEAARLITPWPHDVEHWLNAPTWHWYEAQHGSAGHGDVELWHVPGQSAAATCAPCAPPVVSKHAQFLMFEPVAPHVAVLH